MRNPLTDSRSGERQRLPWLPSTREQSCRSGSAACAASPSRRGETSPRWAPKRPPHRNELAGVTEVYRDSDVTDPSPISLPTSVLPGSGSAELAPVRTLTPESASAASPARRCRQRLVGSASDRCSPMGTDRSACTRRRERRLVSSGLSPALRRLGQDRMTPESASRQRLRIARALRHPPEVVANLRPDLRGPGTGSEPEGSNHPRSPNWIPVAPGHRPKRLRGSTSAASPGPRRCQHGPG